MGNGGWPDRKGESRYKLLVRVGFRVKILLCEILIAVISSTISLVVIGVNSKIK
jgi:hypothetical protein